MAVRPLTDADLDRVLELNQGALPAVGSLDLAALRVLVDRSTMALAVTRVSFDGSNDDSTGPTGSIDATAASAPSELAGFCLVLPPGSEYASVNYRWFADRYTDFAYLDRVVIAPEHRGSGLGRELYEYVEATTDAEWFCLEVNLRPRNDASLAFHERMGFAEVGQQETDYGALVSMQAKRLR